MKAWRQLAKMAIAMVCVASLQAHADPRIYEAVLSALGKPSQWYGSFERGLNHPAACLSLSFGVAAGTGLSARLARIVAADDIPVARRVMVRSEPEYGLERDVPVAVEQVGLGRGVRWKGSPLPSAD
jgi:hypothetical protein